MLFISLQKLFLFSRYLTFCLNFFLVVQQNGLIRRTRSISKFMTSHSGIQTIIIHILSNISRSKSNQTIKFGQLIDYNMRNIFTKKWYTKFGGETSLKPFSVKLKLSISLDQQSKVSYSLFLLHAKLRGYQNILKLNCRILAFISYQVF